MRDFTGSRIGRLTVVEFHSKDKHGLPTWRVVCDCGVAKVVSSSNLMGKTRSCGCLKAEKTSKRMTTHGKTGTLTHRIWKGMISRCYTPSATGYEHYGGRGIGVCPEWRGAFEVFASDMGDAPAGYTIERIDVNADYTPTNCKWLPAVEQPLNTRRNRLVGAGRTPLVKARRADGVSYDSVRARLRRGWGETDALTKRPNTKNGAKRITVANETLTVSEWAVRIGVSPKAVNLRLLSGWTAEAAVTTPKGVKRSHASS